MSTRTILVGLGKVGMGYDLNSPIESFVCTHARALNLHRDFELSCAVDLDGARRRIFESTYSVPAYSTIADALSNHSIDFGVIATPTEVHYQGMRQLLNLATLKAILCEKPLSSKVSESSTMISECNEKNVQVYVNYMRRSEPGVIEVKRRLDTGQIAVPIKGIVWYSKGFLHNGSHFVNLLEYWLGDLIRFKIINPGVTLDGHDATPDVHITFQKGGIFFISSREKNFNHHSIELMAANGRLRYEDGGRSIEWRPVVKDTETPYEHNFGNITEVINSEFSRYQVHVLDNLSLDISGKAGQFCSGAQGLKTHEHVNNILEARDERR